MKTKICKKCGEVRYNTREVNYCRSCLKWNTKIANRKAELVFSNLSKSEKYKQYAV